MTTLDPDPAIVRAFLGMIHTCAAHAFREISDPGWLQLVRINPLDEVTVPTRFKIGDVELMAQLAIADATAGHNVYIEARTVRRSVRGKSRGKMEDTVGCFALVVDSDADIGKAAHVNAVPTFVVETSPKNYHLWFCLDRASNADDARSLGSAMRDVTGGDADTGVVTQFYRVAGTPNYPGKKKQERGRVPVPTRIASNGGPIWSADALAREFPAPPKTSPNGSAPGYSGRTSASVIELVSVPAERLKDRSAQFFEAVCAAVGAGMTMDDLEGVMRQHPQGCAAKYLEGRDRLRTEIKRAWIKAENRDWNFRDLEMERRLRATLEPAFIAMLEARSAGREAAQSSGLVPNEGVGCGGSYPDSRWSSDARSILPTSDTKSCSKTIDEPGTTMATEWQIPPPQQLPPQQLTQGDWIASPTWRERITTANALQYKLFASIRFIIPGLIPQEGVTLISSKPKFGKSWLGLDLSLSITTDRCVLGEIKPEQGDVLLCALEDSERRLQRRITKLLPTFTGNWPNRLMLATSWRRVDEGGIGDLREWCKSVEKPTLIIIDVLERIRPLSKSSEPIYQRDYRALTDLHKLAIELEVAIVVFHHNRKAEANDLIDMVSGSFGLTAAADTVVVIERRTGGIVFDVRGRDLEAAEFAAQFNGETCRWTLLGTAADVHRSHVRGLVLKVFEEAATPLSPKDVAEAIAQSHDNARQLLSRMARNGEIKKDKYGHYSSVTPVTASQSPEWTLLSHNQKAV